MAELQIDGPNRPPAPPMGPPAAAVVFLQRQATASFVVPDSAFTSITWDTAADFTNDASAFDLTDPTDVFLLTDGWHLVTVNLTWENNLVGDRRIKLTGSLVPGSADTGDTRPATPSDSLATPLWSSVTWQGYQHSNDFFSVDAWQNSGGDLTVGQCFLRIAKLT